MFCLFWLVYRGLGEAGREAKLRERRLIRIGKTAGEVDANALFAATRILRMAVIVVAALDGDGNRGRVDFGAARFRRLVGDYSRFGFERCVIELFSAFSFIGSALFRSANGYAAPPSISKAWSKKIGWRTTRLRSFDKRPLYVPNSIFTENVVENADRMTNRRIFETFGIRYEDHDKMQAILKDARAMLAAHPEIDPDLIQMANFDKYDAYSLNFFIYALTRKTGWKIPRSQRGCAFPNRRHRQPTRRRIRLSDSHRLLSVGFGHRRRIRRWRRHGRISADARPGDSPTLVAGARFARKRRSPALARANALFARVLRLREGDAARAFDGEARSARR